MKKTYKIEVDCANCANLMEDAARKTAGVQSATVNFMTQKMIVEFAEGQEPKSVMENVLSACKKVEPDCEIFLSAERPPSKRVTAVLRGAFQKRTNKQLSNRREEFFPCKSLLSTGF